MSRETYIKMTQPFRDNAKLARAIHIANKICTALIFVAYPCFILYMLINHNPLLYKAIVVPLDGFIVLSVFRYFINRPRPYEHFDIPPVISKETKGKSFPSRHVFSAGIIAMTVLSLAPVWWPGVVLLFLAILLGIIRVISGVHYISDVIAGLAFAVIISIFL